MSDTTFHFHSPNTYCLQYKKVTPPVRPGEVPPLPH